MASPIGVDMPKVRIVSLIRSRASWAHVARKLCEALQSLGAEVMIEEDDDGARDTNIHITDSVRRALTTRFSDPDVDLLIVRPERFSGYCKSPLRTGYLVFEADRWPSDWVSHAANHLDLILTPSTFCRDGLIASGAPAAATRILPHGIDPSLFQPTSPRRSDVVFRILFVGTPSRRKGLALLLDALRFARPVDTRISLTIKTERWLDRRDAESGLADKIRSLQALGIECLVVQNFFTEPEMAALYREHDVMCLPHMGEAFGMCVLEAIACGCPVIATAWSGACDFTNSGVGWPIEEFDFTCDDLPLPASFPVPAAARMVVPRVAAIAAKLSEAALAGPAERRRRGQAGAAAARDYSWTNIAMRYLGMVTGLKASGAR